MDWGSIRTKGKKDGQRVSIYFLWGCDFGCIQAVSNTGNADKEELNISSNPLSDVTAAMSLQVLGTVSLGANWAGANSFNIFQCLLIEGAFQRSF